MRPPPKEAEHAVGNARPVPHLGASMRPPPKEAEHLRSRLRGAGVRVHCFNEAASQRGGTHRREAQRQACIAASMRPPPKEAEHAATAGDAAEIDNASMRPPPKEAEHYARSFAGPPQGWDASMRPPPKEAEHRGRV